MQQEQELDETLRSLKDLSAETIDGHRVKLNINIGLEIEPTEIHHVGAEGIGLYRTELPFMVRESFPSEQEQYLLYQQVLSSFVGKPVTMRTLDIGGDKSLSYFPIEEDNPFLGWRGIRISLDQPELFLTQIRAMLRANAGLGNLQIMIPMVSGLPEFDEATNLIQQAYRELCGEYSGITLPPIGTMIEVPSAVYHAVSLAQRADFLSVGSNDLTQYLLAVDRNNPRVASLYDSLHPAMIMALKHVAKAGQMAGTPVTICGEMAGDPLAVVLLMAMGFDGLSMAASNIPRIKWIIRRFTLTHAKSILKDIAAMESAKEVRAHLRLALQRAGLGALIRSATQ
jgi:phosphotransferase system enzyme I (PtsP)